MSQELDDSGIEFRRETVERHSDGEEAVGDERRSSRDWGSLEDYRSSATEKRVRNVVASSKAWATFAPSECAIQGEGTVAISLSY